MSEQGTTPTKKVFEEQGFSISFKVYDFTVLERINHYSMEFEKSWDDLINAALTKFLDDIEAIHKLRL